MTACVSCNVSNPCGATRCGSIFCATGAAPIPATSRHILPRVDVLPFAPGICLGARVGVLARNSDLSNVFLRVRLRGTCDWKLQYPAWDRADDGGVCFRFDDALCALGERLDAELLYNGLVFGHLEIRVIKPPYILTNEITVMRRTAFPYALLAPPGVSAVFEPFYNLYAPLQAILEANASEVPLCTEPRDALCAIPVTTPVQFVLDDGINQEIVGYAGPTLGRVVVTRGQGGTTQRRFPAGTVLRFAWTPANVVAAQEAI